MTLFLSLAFVACTPKMEAPELTGPDTKWYVGHESNSSFILDHVNQLGGLAELVNGGINFNGKTITLTKNIDISTYGVSTKASASNWTPIGTYDQPFRGTFDGNGYEITGLVINDETLEEVGFFGCISGGIVKNLGLVDVNIRAFRDIGGITGILYNGGSIINCHVTGTISSIGRAGGIAGDLTNSSISSCYVTGTISCTDGGNIGGIAGIGMGGSITNCYTTCTLTNNNDWPAGGIIGIISGSSNINIANCYATGSVNNGWVVGGIVGSAVGSSPASITNCVALNSSVSSVYTGVGRIISSETVSVTLNNNWARSDMEVIKDGGIKVLNKGHDTEDGEDVTVATAQTIAFWTGTMMWSTLVWDISAGNYPTLK